MLLSALNSEIYLVAIFVLNVSFVKSGIELTHILSLIVIKCTPSSYVFVWVGLPF